MSARYVVAVMTGLRESRLTSGGPLALAARSRLVEPLKQPSTVATAPNFRVEMLTTGFIDRLRTQHTFTPIYEPQHPPKVSPVDVYDQWGL